MADRVSGKSPHCLHRSMRQLFEARDYITGEPFQIKQCQECGLARTFPELDPEALLYYYPPAYYGSCGSNRFPKLVEWLQNGIYGSRVRRLEAFVEGKRVLDVGCGRGELLRVFKNRGWEVEGTELSEASAQYARKIFQLPVKVGELTELAMPPEHYDAIVLWHVLEHVTYPDALIQEIHRLLKPNGVVLISVPNFSSPEAKFTGASWFHLDIPRHQFHFGSHTLLKWLQANHFSKLETSYFTPEYDLFSFVQSIQSKMGLQQNLLYNLLRSPGARFSTCKKAAKLESALALLSAPVLGMLALPATTFLSLMRRGSTVTVIARRQCK